MIATSRNFLRYSKIWIVLENKCQPKNCINYQYISSLSRYTTDEVLSMLKDNGFNDPDIFFLSFLRMMAYFPMKIVIERTIVHKIQIPYPVKNFKDRETTKHIFFSSLESNLQSKNTSLKKS